jgi:hypothetical protein
MDLIELQEMINKSFPDKKICYDFDHNCGRLINICMTEGVPHLYHQIEFNRVKLTIEGMESQYIGIQSHRVAFTWTDIQKMVEEKAKSGDVFISEINIKELLAMKAEKPDLFNTALDELVIASGLDKEKIESKLGVVKCE